MNRITSVSELDQLRNKIISSLEHARPCITVCTGTGCCAMGGEMVIDAFKNALLQKNLTQKVDIRPTGCHGFCEQGPIVIIKPEGLFYPRVKPEDAKEIVEQTIINKKIIERLLYVDPATGEKITYENDVPFYKYQQRVLLKYNGEIDPTIIHDYIAIGGYSALSTVLGKVPPEEIIECIKRSGLRGRGGAGFPTGLKWEFCRKAKGQEKFVICNADEGDPGAYMDRSILEANPHSVIEGMIIGAYAIGANQGIVYVRNEYPLAVRRLSIAIKQARELGILGKNILGSGFNFDIKISRGAGAFVCGEESALLSSVEGLIGEPRQRPPYPAQRGLWKRPTNINNVKTWASVPLIINNGAEWFSSIGTEKSKGTMIFSLVGKVNNTGLVEVPMGITLEDLIFKIGGGISKNRRFKAVQTGGPSGGCIPAKYLNLQVDYEQLTQVGSMMGSGGMIVMDERTCMVDVARYFLNFLKEESCGKCTACREGVDRMHEILTQICDGNGKEGDIELLEEIGTVVKDFALCALGGTAPNPVLSTTKYFKEEYEAHIKYKKCPAVVCKKIISSPCQHVCPLGTDVPAYVTLIAKGEFEKALDVVRKTNPLPLICGRVCHHPCEQYCALGDGADPLAIKSLKRFLTDWELTNKGVYRISPSPIKYEKVAIIGSGPAGLTCAYMLRNLGYDTTIFEKTDVIGGMLALTIPDYRLPKNLLNMEIETIKSAGVNIKTNCEITNLDELFNQDFKAIFIATGAHKDLKLGIPGEDIKGVINALEFLKDVKSGKKVQVGDKVGIVGGGNTAIDAARTALRLGAKEVTILYRRTRAEMPAISEEVDSAIHEGINIKFLTAPTKIEAHNGKLRVECVKMQLGSIDASGRRRPIPIKGSEYAIELDTLIPAIGQQPQIPFAQQSGIKLARGNTIKVDPETLATDRQGVFAGGDVVSGPATVVEAIKAGTVAAESIHRFLRGQSLKREYHITKPSVDVEPIEFSDEEIEEILKTKRPSMPHIPREKRIFTFNEVDLGFTKEMAMKEATRCLRCDKMI